MCTRYTYSHHFVYCILSVNACCIHCFFEHLRGGYRISEKGGVVIINNKTSGGGGGVLSTSGRFNKQGEGGGVLSVCFQPIQWGGGGGVLSQYNCKRKKKVILDKRGGGGGLQPPTPPPPPPPPPASYLMTKHIFRSAGVDMASVYLNLQKQFIYSCIHVTLQCCCSV